tara:strand:- start:2800 stop:3504 length:705 start_codon:yes stop_codon:yes gene_type:complete
MLVSSFDTKYSKTASKYESLDNNFTSILSKDKKFSRIFTSVIENKDLELSTDISLRSDITGQVINTILTHDYKSAHYLYYMGDVFKKDIINNQIKQYRQHGVEIINRQKKDSFKEVIKILDKILFKILKKNYFFIFTDPKIRNTKNFLLDGILQKNNINNFINIFKSSSKSPYALNLEKNFFSKDYHQDIFFYVYSTKSKKVLAQGGGYQYHKNKKNIEGFGFSCNVDNLADLI